MIIFEYIEAEKRERRYSNLNVKIRQVETGHLYDDAVDAIPCRFTYEETDIPIEDDKDAAAEDHESVLPFNGEDF